MTVHEAHEPSYYEIALTNRQVLAAFVVILGAVVGAFLCGVWVGRNGTDAILAQELTSGDGTQVAQAADGQQDGDELESFRFFTDEDPQEEKKREKKQDEPRKRHEDLRKPDLSRLLEEPEKETTLAEDVGSEARKPQPAPATPPPPPAPSPPPPAPSPPPPAPSPPPPAPSPPPPEPAASAAAEAPDEPFIVQVFSTHEEPHAKEVLAQLEAEGYEGFVSPLEKADGTYYRVRIGPFEEKARAERAARGIRKKFKLETWVTAASN